MKKCPYCFGMNNDNKTTCIYCGQSLATIAESKKEEDRLFKVSNFLNADDKVQLGKMYQVGIGCTKSIERAKELFYQAAAEGNADGMYLYAELLYESSSENDKKAAIHYYKEAAEQGHIGAAFRLKELNKNNINSENSPLMETVQKVRPYCLEIISTNVIDVRCANSQEELEQLVNMQREIMAKTGSSGSGVLLDNGYIITNAHVVINAFELEKQSGISQVILGSFKNIEEQIPLKLIYMSVEEDVAILKPIGKELDYSKAPKLMQPLNVQMGQTVFTIGNGHADGNALSSGQVSQELRQDNKYYKYREVFVSNMVINPGNSGGGVFDLDGNVLGMVTYGPADGEKGSIIYGITYCVTANTIQQVINKITKKY